MTILAVFRSRDQTMDYANRLRRYGVSPRVVNTPKEAKVGCGISVQFARADFAKARAVLGLGRYSTFRGFFEPDYSLGYMRFVPFGG